MRLQKDKRGQLILFIYIRVKWHRAFSMGYLCAIAVHLNLSSIDRYWVH